MDNRPIGIFDSGLGGLTAVMALRRLMPEENIVYFADSARVPYGEKSREELLVMARQDLDLLASFSAKAIIAACGTVSSNAPHILEGYPLPVCGVLNPGIEAMARVPGRAPLGIIATAASIKAGAFRRALTEKAPGRQIIDLPCPDFVPLIESGHTSPQDPALRRAVEEALAPVKAAGAGALLLGCAHDGWGSAAIRGAPRRQRGDPVLHQRRCRRLLCRGLGPAGAGNSCRACACYGNLRNKEEHKQ